jgi:hypothetical protein
MENENIRALSMSFFIAASEEEVIAPLSRAGYRHWPAVESRCRHSKQCGKHSE